MRKAETAVSVQYSEDGRQLAEQLKSEILRGIDLTAEISDEMLMAVIDGALNGGRDLRLTLGDRLRLRKELFDSFRRLDVIQELVEDEDVTEIMVNGTSAIFYEKAGRLYRWGRNFASRERLEDVIQQIVARVNRTVNTGSPIVDARLPDGSRVNAVLPPAAPDGPILTIRRFPKERITMSRLIGSGSISAEAAAFLMDTVRAGYNIFISGGTGSGKTTFLNALSEAIPPDERVVTIEDSMELQLNIANLVRLEARSGNGEGTEQITIRDLIRTALRMRPDRLIVGEVRGAEALDMLQAMNTGHDGSLSTGHGNSPADMLSRLEMMVLMGGELPLGAVRSQIGSALQIMVHLSRLRDGSRKVMSIDEVTGYKDGEIGLRTLYIRHAGELEPVCPLLGRERLEAAGLQDVPPVGS